MTRGLAEDGPIPREVARQAVAWLVELQADDVPEPVYEAWRQWRAAHPDHERAWCRIERVDAEVSRAASPVNSAIAHATLERKPARRHALLRGLGVLFVVGVGGWLVEDATPWRRWTADHRTAIGERRTVRLPDDTQLTLNTNTAIDVRFDDTARRVRLVSGEILVTTHPDSHSPARPFLVETDDGEAVALGTRYAVRHDDGPTRVSVHGGAVEIRPRGTPDRTTVLRAGEEAIFSGESIGPTQALDRNGTTWTDGLIVAMGMPLGEMVRELNRYSAVPLSCDPSVAGLRVSGSYPVADIPKVLDTLGAVLSLHVRPVTRLWGRQVVELRLVPAPPPAGG